MKNVTIALDDETHRKARIKAAELGTSLSALVKDYLTALIDESAGAPSVSGVRDMHSAYTPMPGDLGPSAPPAEGPPWLVDGKWVYTRDGKPRQPGALRGKIHWTEDFDEWPEGFLDALYGDETEASQHWWESANDRLKPKES
jgi:hypothetical protein